jgi:hypothetical protein
MAGQAGIGTYGFSCLQRRCANRQIHHYKQHNKQGYAQKKHPLIDLGKKFFTPVFNQAALWHEIFF